MDKVTFIKVIGSGEVEIEHAIIEHADGSFTSMTKAHYEELEAAKEVKADGNPIN